MLRAGPREAPSEVRLARMEFGKLAFAIFCALVALSLTEATLSKRDKKTKSKDKNKVGTSYMH